MARAVILALVPVALAACQIRDNLVDCGDGRSCPIGTTCTPTSCGDSEAVAACEGIEDGGSCTAPDAPDGVCALRVCSLRGCGNGVVDANSDETCDDANTAAGDGCNSLCRLEGCGNGSHDPGELCDDGNTESSDGCSAACQREELQWTSLEASTDDEREGAAVVFDVIRGRVIRFGGVDVIGTLRGSTHELVGGQWQRVLSARAPSARAYAATAYDTVRKKWVLFGGSTETGMSADTWEFDGTEWTERTIAGPPAGMHVMAFDSAGSRIVLYVTGPTAETWTYNGTAWTKLTGASPPPRTDTALAYDAAGARVILFGGAEAAGTNSLADTWALVGTTWTPLTTTNTPPAMYSHALAYDPARSGIVLHDSIDTWLLQGTAWTALTSLDQLRWAYGMAVVHDPVRGALVRYGGSAGQFSIDDIYELGAAGWNQLALRPSDRTAALHAVDTLRNRLIVLGGSSWNDGDFNQTWSYDATGWRRLAPATVPPEVSYQGMAYDSARDRMVAVIGNETWELDGTDWAQVTTAVNTPWLDGPMVYDADRARMVAIVEAETFVYNGTDWQALALTGTNRPGNGNVDHYAVAYDSDRKRVMMFDKFDLWELDDNTWIRHRTTPSPHQRWGSVMVYDPIRRRLVFCAGNELQIGKFNDTWEWDGTAWTQVITRNTYLPREVPVMAWLPWSKSILMYGGNDASITLHDTWELRMTERE